MQAKKDKADIDKLLLALENECHRCSQPGMEENSTTRIDCTKTIDSLNQSLKAAGGSNKYSHPCYFWGPIPGSRLHTYKQFQDIKERDAKRELEDANRELQICKQ